MDRCWNTTITWSQVYWSVGSHHPIATTYDHSVPRASDGAIHYSDTIGECRKKFDDASQWLLEDWISTLAKGRGAKKIFQHCMNPNSSNQFLHFRAIQGHSGDNAVDLAFQDNVMLPKGFTEYIYHVGNANGASREEDKQSSSRQWTRCKTYKQSFSKPHYLQLTLRKRYCWKLRVSSTRRYA